jgi:hypothetical protein
MSNNAIIRTCIACGRRSDALAARYQIDAARILFRNHAVVPSRAARELAFINLVRSYISRHGAWPDEDEQPQLDAIGRSITVCVNCLGPIQEAGRNDDAAHEPA